jgi:valyl-tRNA synthetase
LGNENTNECSQKSSIYRGFKSDGEQFDNGRPRNSSKYLRHENTEKTELLGNENNEVTAGKKLDQELREIVAKLTEALENYKPGLAADLLYDSFWHYFCDVAIEQAKKGLLSPTRLAGGLEVYLKLWQPIVPFVTEAAWQELGETALLAASGWPETAES